MPIKVDVLIPTCDRPQQLVATLAGLAAQGGPRNRIVISDQSHGTPSFDTPAAAAMVRLLTHYGHEVRLERHLPRRGPAEQRAFLLEQARADHVAFLDDDVWLEPGALARLYRAIRHLDCGVVGYAAQRLSHVRDRRPAELAAYEEWTIRPLPERVEPGSAAWGRWTLHNAANLVHLAADLRLPPDQWRPYKIAWVRGCVLYNRAALLDAGGFDFWPRLPVDHDGDDILAQLRVIALHAGAGILPSAAVHLESPTAAPRPPVRPVHAFDVMDPFADLPTPLSSRRTVPAGPA